MRDELFYSDLTAPQPSRIPLSYFMMLAVLKARTETGMGETAGDEDVNMYLSSALGSAADPRYLEWARPFIFEYGSDVFASIEHTPDTRLKYTTYRVNADHLLLEIGIFDREHTEALRCRWYYGFANAYSQQLARRRTGLSEVLDKMAHNFDRYASVLGVVRREYFNLVETLSARAWAEIQRDVAHQQMAVQIDQLLDVYSRWLQASRPEHVREMETLLAQIRVHRPDFAFDLPRGSAS